MPRRALFCQIYSQLMDLVSGDLQFGGAVQDWLPRHRCCPPH
jgi:hypothetical protein